jgi:hypothetical protein
MLDQFTINHIKNAFDLAAQGQISQEARSRIAYTRKLIAVAEEAALIRQAGNHARASGAGQVTSAAQARQYLDGVAAECAIHGCD